MKKHQNTSTTTPSEAALTFSGKTAAFSVTVALCTSTALVDQFSNNNEELN